MLRRKLAVAIPLPAFARVLVMIRSMDSETSNGNRYLLAVARSATIRCKIIVAMRTGVEAHIALGIMVRIVRLVRVVGIELLVEDGAVVGARVPVLTARGGEGAIDVIFHWGLEPEHSGLPDGSAVAGEDLPKIETKTTRRLVEEASGEGESRGLVVARAAADGIMVEGESDIGRPLCGSDREESAQEADEPA